MLLTEEGYHSADLLYWIAVDQVGCFSFNHCAGKIQFNNTKDMFSRSKNVLKKLVSFLALVWGAANQGRPETVHIVGGRK